MSLNSNILQNNINALASGVNEPLATKIVHFLNTQNLSRFKLLENGDILDIQNQVLIYENVQEELKKAFVAISSQSLRYPFVCIYGIANGLLVKHLAPHYQHILVFENELELFILALSFVDLSKELASGRVYLLDSSEEKMRIQALMLFDFKDIFEYLSLYRLFISSLFYKKFYQEQIDFVDALCFDSINLVIRNSGANLDLCLKVYENLLQNIPIMLENIPYQTLLTQRKDQFNTAVVVSAGPSLTKQLPLLKKYQNKAVIFAVDGALKTLLQNEITPDYVLNIDFAHFALEFFKEDTKQDYLAFLSVLTHPSLASRLKYKCIALNDDLSSRHFKLDEFGYIETGTTVSHCAYALALQLGFKIIIAIGQDLAFDEKGRSHTAGFAYGESVESEDRQDKFKVEAYGGVSEVLTHKTWNDYRIKLEYLFSHHSNKARFINATEGGARIRFSEELSFKKCCEQFLIKNKPHFEDLKALSRAESEKLLLKFKEKLKQDEQSCETFLSDSTSLLKALESILNAHKDLPLEFLQNVEKSILNFDHQINQNEYLNTNTSRILLFKKGVFLCEVIKMNLEDEKTFLLHFINAYKNFLLFFIEQIRLRKDVIAHSLSLI